MNWYDAVLFCNWLSRKEGLDAYYTGCDVSESELNHFMGSHRVLAGEKRFVDVGENSFWAVCVDYLDVGSAGDKSSSRSQRNQIDYRRILSDEQFTVFAALRELRKELAAQDGVPLYTVFTNQQLAQIVQLKITDRANLKKVDGVGDGATAATPLSPLLSQHESIVSPSGSFLP